MDLGGAGARARQHQDRSPDWLRSLHRWICGRQADNDDLFVYVVVLNVAIDTCRALSLSRSRSEANWSSPKLLHVAWCAGWRFPIETGVWFGGQLSVDDAWRNLGPSGLRATSWSASSLCVDVSSSASQAQMTPAQPWLR